MSLTLTCKDCGVTGEANDLDWVRSSKYASGYHSRCRPCLSKHRREQKRKRAERMTDAEWEAERERKQAYRKKYNAENADKIAASRKASKAKAAIPSMIQELRKLHDARRARDLGAEWKEWCKHAKDAARDRHGVDYKNAGPPDGVNEYTDPVAYAKWEREVYKPYREARKRYDEDPTIRFISEVEWTLTCREYQMGYLIDRRFEELVAQMEAFSSEEINAALTHVPAPREPQLSPSTKRALRRFMRDWENREAALTEEEKAERQARWDELLVGCEFTGESYERQRREDFDAAEEGRHPDYLLETVEEGEQWGYLQRRIDEQKAKEKSEAGRRAERNRRRKERRKKKRELEQKEAERRAYKAQHERERRARLKAKGVDSPETE